MLVNIDLRPTFVKNRKFSKFSHIFKCNFYLDPKILLDARGGEGGGVIGFEALGFRSMKKWQISKPKIVHWYQVKERHLFFQNLFFKTMGNLAGPLYMSPVDCAGPALTWLIYMRDFSPVSEMRKSQRSWERVLAPNLRNKANSRLS